MFLLRRPSNVFVHAFLERQPSSKFSYAHFGASREGDCPSAYVSDHNRVQLGCGASTWTVGKQSIREWQMFDIPRLQLCWPNGPITEGTNLAIAIRHFGFWSLNASRIVYVMEEERRFGFAYGTLMDHSESGEERFMVEWNVADDSVWYDLFAFSRPNAALARFAHPLARRLQRRFARDSMTAMVDCSRDASA